MCCIEEQFSAHLQWTSYLFIPQGKNPCSTDLFLVERFSLLHLRPHPALSLGVSKYALCFNCNQPHLIVMSRYADHTLSTHLHYCCKTYYCWRVEKTRFNFIVLLPGYILVLLRPFPPFHFQDEPMDTDQSSTFLSSIQSEIAKYQLLIEEENQKLKRYKVCFFYTTPHALQINDVFHVTYTEIAHKTTGHVYFFL